MAAAGLGFSSSLPLSFEAPARRTAIVAGMLAGGATGGRRPDPVVPDPDIAAAASDSARLGQGPSVMGGQAHELPDHGRPWRLMTVLVWAVMPVLSLFSEAGSTR